MEILLDDRYNVDLRDLNFIALRIPTPRGWKDNLQET